MTRKKHNMWHRHDFIADIKIIESHSGGIVERFSFNNIRDYNKKIRNFFRKIG